MTKKWFLVPGFIGIVFLIAGFLIQDGLLFLFKWNLITRYPVIFNFRVGTGRVLKKKFGTGRVPGSRRTLLPMHVLHIAQVHGSSTNPSSNGQTWYNRGERHIPSNTRQEQLWPRSSKLALFWQAIMYYLLCQGQLHKSEKRATSSGGKSDEFLFYFP